MRMICTLKEIKRLIVVSSDQNGALGSQKVDEGYLQLIEILKFVDQDLVKGWDSNGLLFKE